jgi:DNA-binding CsgD family transcriptional regulator
MGTDPGKPPSVLVTREPTPLLERQAELDLVDRLLADAPTGRGGLLLLEGPAGIGKSRVLGAARERAREQGLRVLSARGGELERSFSHGVVRQLFEPALAACDDDERAVLLSGAASLAAPLLQYADPEQAFGADGDASFPVLHGLYWLTANLSESSPVLIVVDDLHWCDAPSLRFLAYLARRLEGLPVVLAAAVRVGEPGLDAGMLAELESEALATVGRPAPLSEPAVAELLEARLGSEPAPAFLDAVYQASGGNPFLVGELVHTLREEGVEPTAAGAARVHEMGPETLSRFVLQRIRRLGTPAEALARAVAVLGDASELSLAASLAVLDENEAASAAAALGRVEILRPRGTLGFVHPVLRAAVYEDLSDPERELAHERAAELLGEAGAAPQHVAAHLLHVPPRGRHSIVTLLREAAGRSASEGAVDTARSYLVRALAEPPPETDRAAVLLELGTVELRSGAPEATEHLREAGAAATGESALTLANALQSEGRPYEAAETLRDALARLGPEEESLAQHIEGQLIGWQRFDARTYPEARERLARLAPGATEDSFGGCFLLSLAASELARAGESPEEAHELVERALTGHVALRHENWTPYAIAANVLVTLDDLEAALPRLDDLLAVARQRGSAYSFAYALNFRALAMLRRGDLVEAEADVRTALEAIEPVAGRGGYAETRGYLTETLLERGELEEAARVLDDAGAPSDDPTLQVARLIAARARLRVATGDNEAGLGDLLEVGERLEALGVRNPSYVPWRSQAALVLLGRDELAEAQRLVSEELEIARRWKAPRAVGAALRAAGLVEGGDAGLALLREAVAVLEASPARLERAYALTDLGAALRRGNQRAEAREHLRSGLELAERCGARPLGERAHTELVATGARPRRALRTGVDALTPSERRVAGMAAEGQTNREIAQALFVTPKTVETHLSHVYSKLDIKARSQLGSAMAAEPA